MNAVGFCGCPNESDSKQRIGSGNMLWSWNLHGASVPSDEKLAARVLEVFCIMRAVDQLSASQQVAYR